MDALETGPRNWRLAACIFFALMIAIGAIPGEATMLSARINDKLLHFCAYGLLSAMVFNGLTVSAPARAFRTVLLIAALGALDEFIQSFMPYRNAGIRDWLVDILAALCCVALLLAVRILHDRRKAARSANSQARAQVEGNG